MEFCQYLAETNQLPPTDVEQLQRLVHRSRPQIGRVLIELGVMDLRQVMKVMSVQAEEPQTRFGDLAVRCGYLTRDQLDHALAEQRRLTRHAAEIMHRESMLSDEALVKALIGYARGLEDRLQRPAPRLR